MDLEEWAQRLGNLSPEVARGGVWGGGYFLTPFQVRVHFRFRVEVRWHRLKDSHP